MRKRFFNILIFLLLAVFVIWLALQWNRLPSLKNWFKSKPVTIQNTPVAIKQIRALAQLITVSMYEELVVDSNAVDNTTLNLPLLPGIMVRSSERSLVLVGKITTQVGIDMQKLGNSDISGTTDSIHILLPPAEVLDAIINPSDVTVFIEKGEWNNTAVINLKNKMQTLAIADAQSRGLLGASEAKAREVLTRFFKAAGYRQVEIRFKERGILKLN